MSAPKKPSKAAVAKALVDLQTLWLEPKLECAPAPAGWFVVEIIQRQQANGRSSERERVASPPFRISRDSAEDCLQLLRVKFPGRTFHIRAIPERR
jgi:hypothetical protein